jgi:hypothetical protein
VSITIATSQQIVNGDRVADLVGRDLVPVVGDAELERDIAGIEAEKHRIERGNDVLSQHRRPDGADQ